MAKIAKRKRNTPYFLKIVKWFWILFFSGILFIAFLFLLASWEVFGEMPTFEELENPKTDLASEVISSDGITLGKYYLNENRTPSEYEDFPKHLIQALVATEDERFYNHSGIDFKATARALIYLGSKGGASTITQQLSKLLFHRKRTKGIKRYTQKIKEYVISIRLERQYTKEEIITMYLNKMDFIHHAVGIRSASRIYFNKEPKNLRLEESAVLVGMLKNPWLYNPYRKSSKKRCLQRRNQVLKQMFRNHFITKDTKDSIQKLPLNVDFSPEGHSDGYAPYFRMYLKNRFMKKWLAENPKSNGEKHNLYLDGLKIYTTIDSRMQQNAETATMKHMKRLQEAYFAQNTLKKNKTAPFHEISRKEIDIIIERAIKNSSRWKEMKSKGISEKEIRASFQKKTEMSVFTYNNERYTKDTLMSPLDSIRYYKFFLRTALMSMEPQTGHIKAWVGGVNYKHFQYDQVIQGARQTGSIFKPFLYAAAIDQLRLSPCDSFPDIRVCIEAQKYGNPEAWCPKNANGKYSGEMLTLKEAIAKSKNSISAKLMKEIGPGPVIQIARNLGIKNTIEKVPSIALGTPDITLHEMVGAHSTFANKGVYVEPVLVTRIEDKNGLVLYEYIPKTRDVLSEEVSYIMVDLMKGVVDAGSGSRLKHSTKENDKLYQEIITGYPYKFLNPIAGKTGTTQNNSDGWFIGMVPNLITGIWVGGDDRAVRFANTAYGQGASMALPIWALYMNANYQNKDLGVSDEDFEKPKNLSIEVDCDSLKVKTNKNTLDENLEDEDLDEF